MRAAHPAVPAAAAAATDAMKRDIRTIGGMLLLTAGVLLGRGAHAGVLPEDRADVLYHYYDGGGVQIDGPSLLVRKSIGQSVSVSASYYVDTISSASIDVVTTASPYKEERKQWGAGIDYLHGDTTLSFGASRSDETDYEARSLNFGISQDMFGGLTTVTMGYGRGSDDVSKRGAPDFSDTIDRRAYRLGVSQVLTRNLILGLNYETIADEGFLNNPYRRVRYLDGNEPRGYGLQDEIYPRTRASNAVSVRFKYHLPYRAAVSGQYRFYTDDWGIDAHTVQFGYVQPWKSRWTFDASYRAYTQSSADFFSDLFPHQDAQNFLARDKELSTFVSHGPHIGVSYRLFERQREGQTLRSTVSLFYDRMFFSYDDFRDLRVQDVEPGTEPAYDFDADIIQIFFSLWF